jgi:FtsP/CotA-like multicopper oxidase with cupredoxin domain
MIQRPDLADPHTIHYHGYPEAATIFDGVPEVTLSINEGASLTYFYEAVEPGTFFWHCHVEASEHMQMGMIGNLWVRPLQNRLPDGTMLGDHMHSNPDNPDGLTERNSDNPIDGDKYVFNDGDGSTQYDVEYPVQVTTWDPVFHDASRDTQPLPFIDMFDTISMINGRVYPDTTVEAPLTNPAETLGYGTDTDIQPMDAMIRATQGEKILLRISNVSTTDQMSVRTLGLTMKVVGHGGRILRGEGKVDGLDMSYETSNVVLSGGDARSAIIDTTDVAPGTYFLYTTQLRFLTNDTEDYSGALTEIVIAAAP